MVGIRTCGCRIKGRQMQISPQSYEFESRPLFVQFCPFHNAMTNIICNLTICKSKSRDGVVGIRTCGCRIKEWQMQTNPPSYEFESRFPQIAKT